MYFIVLGHIRSAIFRFATFGERRVSSARFAAQDRLLLTLGYWSVPNRSAKGALCLAMFGLSTRSPLLRWVAFRKRAANSAGV